MNDKIVSGHEIKPLSTGHDHGFLWRIALEELDTTLLFSNNDNKY